MNVERPYLWVVGAAVLLAVSASAGYFLLDSGDGAVEFHMTNAPPEESVVVTIERDDGESLEQIHRTTVTGPRETVWTATEPGYYEVTLATADKSCTRGIVLEVVDGDLTVGNDDAIQWSDCPGILA
jgi:hypothetical protein